MPNLVLISLLVVHNLDLLQGCPVAWLLFSRENTDTLTAFVKGLRQAVENAGLAFPKANAFMSDCFEGSYKAWVRALDEDQPKPRKLLCSFHVVRAWRAKLNLIKASYGT